MLLAEVVLGGAGYPTCMRPYLALAATLLSASPVLASGTLGYGSRAGMEVDVVSMSGLDTAHAVIKTRHTRANAIAFCRDYVQKVTPQCINEELAVRLNDEVTADCVAGTFTTFYGDRYRFAGPSKDKDGSAKYRVIDLSTGETADGSSASGYGTNIEIYKALCGGPVATEPKMHFKTARALWTAIDCQLTSPDKRDRFSMRQS